MENNIWKIKSKKKIKPFKNVSGEIDDDLLEILNQRGIKTEKEVNDFLFFDINDLKNPLDLADMEETIDIILKAVESDKNIWIYGDYDVDGITSTSLLYLVLKEIGAKNVNYYVPIRNEGYGLNKEALKKIKESDGDIVITVDCGITSFEEIDFATSIELPIIITDHHDIQKNGLPKALTVINPKREDNAFSFKNLAGVGTAFMIVLALYDKLGRKEKAYDYIEIAAIGTVADIVPLVEDNRIMVSYGLVKLKDTNNVGLKYLIEQVFDKDKEEFTTYDIGFIIGPIFNAAGRLKDAKAAVKLLTSTNMREIEIITKDLIGKNYERKLLQENIIKLVEENIKNKSEDDFVIVDASPEYHHGVIGIAASKVLDKTNKPTVIMEVREDQSIAVASCRSIDKFNIIKALQSMPELFVKFGGHANAAGFTISTKNIDLFTKKINKLAKEQMTEKDLVKVINIDILLPIQKVSYEFYKRLELLKPFGYGNTNPTFLTQSVMFENIKPIGENKNHLMFDLKKEGYTIRNAVWFNSGEKFKELNENLFYDIVYKIKIEEYQGKYYTKVYMEDIKPSKLVDDRLYYYNSMFLSKFPFESVFYTNIDIDDVKDIDYKYDFDQVSLYQGRQFLGKLDYNVSNYLTQLHRFYNWDFKIEMSAVEKTNFSNIVRINIDRDYDFKSLDYIDKRLFINIKKFLIGDMEYDSYTKLLLSEFFKNDKNFIIKNINNFDFSKYILTLGIYGLKKENKKSNLITTKKREKEITSIMNQYFDINEKKEEEDYFFTFIDIRNMKNQTEKIEEIIKKYSDLDKRYVVLTDEKQENKKIDNLTYLDYKFEVPSSVDFIDNTKKMYEDVDNSYFYFLPIKNKINIKNHLKIYNKIYSDSSIFEIL